MMKDLPFYEGRRQKKVLALMARPLRPNPPPLSSLMAVVKLERWEKSEKSTFSSMARPFTFPPLNGPAIKRRTFIFAASLSSYCKFL